MFDKQHEVGAPPGTLLISAGSPPPKIHAMHFTPDELIEEDVEDVRTIRTAFRADVVSWIDVQGFGDQEFVRKIGERFSLHPLVIEDLVNVPQRPKAESYQDHILCIVKMVTFEPPCTIEVEQVSIIIGKQYVLTVQERYGDVLDPVRKRIRAGNAPICREGSDYVMYAIFDTIIDAYYPVLEQVGEYLGGLEDAILKRPRPVHLKQLTRIKNQLSDLRRAIWPQREAANRLARDEELLIDPNVRLFLRDTYAHCVQTSEVVETYREMVLGLMHIHLSSIANRTNEVMKVLTIVATIFIPLTFIVGVYGMNFEHMPELKVWWAYPLVWLIMVAIALAMLWGFYRKGWMGGAESGTEEE